MSEELKQETVYGGEHTDRMYTPEDMLDFVRYMYNHKIAHDYKDGKEDYDIFFKAIMDYMELLNNKKK